MDIGKQDIFMYVCVQDRFRFKYKSLCRGIRLIMSMKLGHMGVVNQDLLVSMKVDTSRG